MVEGRVGRQVALKANLELDPAPAHNKHLRLIKRKASVCTLVANVVQTKGQL